MDENDYSVGNVVAGVNYTLVHDHVIANYAMVHDQYDRCAHWPEVALRVVGDDVTTQPRATRRTSGLCYGVQFTL